jgi:TRAP-type mannitol/chloroaromatic compound transport system permease large subunit
MRQQPKFSRQTKKICHWNRGKSMGFEWLAIAMFAGFFVILMSGYPVSFSFAGTALVFGGIGWLVGAFDLDRLFLLSNNWFGTMSNFTLLAIPFFVFLGAVLEKSGLAEELLETVAIVLGALRGGVALAVILVGRRHSNRYGDAVAADHAPLWL